MDDREYVMNNNGKIWKCTNIKCNNKNYLISDLSKKTCERCNQPMSMITKYEGKVIDEKKDEYIENIKNHDKIEPSERPYIGGFRGEKKGYSWGEQIIIMIIGIPVLIWILLVLLAFC